MTLKARNNLTLTFSTLFLAICSAALLYYLYKLNIIINAKPHFSYEFPRGNFSFWTNNVWVLFFEALAMAIYIPAAAFYAYARFEKTPSNEIAYFILFLMGCVPELLRPCIPLEISRDTFSSFLVIVGKALFWGRTLSFTSLFAASLILDSKKNLNAERHFVVMLIFSLAIASSIPVNTTKILPAFNIQIGWHLFAALYYALTALLSLISYAINARINENPLYLRLGLDVMCVMAGLLTLNGAAILATAIPGTFLLFFGTFRYFNNLHKLYY